MKIIILFEYGRICELSEAVIVLEELILEKSFILIKKCTERTKQIETGKKLPDNLDRYICLLTL